MYEQQTNTGTSEPGYKSRRNSKEERGRQNNDGPQLSLFWTESQSSPRFWKVRHPCRPFPQTAPCSRFPALSMFAKFSVGGGGGGVTRWCSVRQFASTCLHDCMFVYGRCQTVARFSSNLSSPFLMEKLYFGSLLDGRANRALSCVKRTYRQRVRAWMSICDLAGD